MKSFEGSFRNLNFSPSTSILLNLFFPFTDITCFFSNLKLQYCRTIVLLNFSKKPLFQKRRWSCGFPPRQTPVAQKHRAISCQEKMAFSNPASGCLGTPLPLPQSLYGQMYADVTTKISRIDRLPNLLSNGAPLIYYTSNNENENLRFEVLCLAFANFYRLTAVKPSLDKP